MLCRLWLLRAGGGTWPAWWAYGPGWPNKGEIDIIETVNTEQDAQSTLHTSPGCSMPSFSGSLCQSVIAFDGSCVFLLRPVSGFACLVGQGFSIPTATPGVPLRAVEDMGLLAVAAQHSTRTGAVCLPPSGPAAESRCGFSPGTRFRQTSPVKSQTPQGGASLT